MKTILERINSMDQYESWKFVKQNYRLNVMRHFIKMVVLFQKQSEQINFESFCESHSGGDKTLANFRSARNLLDLGIIENQDMKVSYRDYIIPKEVIEAAFYHGDSQLRYALISRMIKKDRIFKQKSNKISNVSTKDEILFVEPYFILIKLLINLYNETNQAYISKKEISNFVVIIQKESEINEVVKLIQEYRKDNTILKREIKENRFHTTLNLIPGIEVVKNGFNYDPKTLSGLLKLQSLDDLVISSDDIQELKLDPENLDYLMGLKMTSEAKSQTRNSRIQYEFRKKLINEFKGKCAFCSLTGATLMVASHAKSFADCYKDLDIESFATQYNGLLLCKNHDALFDRHLISITSNGEVVGDDMGVETFSSIANKKWWVPKRKVFLEYHFNKYKDKK